MLVNQSRTFAPRSRRQLAGLWDDYLDTPTIELLPGDVDTGEVIDKYDARDAWNAGTGTVPAVVSGSSDWNLRDILKTGTSIVREVMQYKTTQIPGGGQIYTRIDPRTGQPVYGGRDVMLPAGGFTNFVSQNMPLLLISGVLILGLAMKGKD